MGIRLACFVTFRPCIVVAALLAGTLGSCLCTALAGPRQPDTFVSGQDAGDRPAFTTKTFTYKTAGATPVRADVYRAGDTKVRPVKELARHRVPHELITVEGAGHGLAGGDRKRVAEAQERALAFIRKHLR
jgi:hypothetical protein